MMFRPRLIGLVGLAGAGKSTLAGALTRWHGYERQRLAGPLKDMASSFLRAAGIPEQEVFERVDGSRKEETIPALGVTTRHVMQTLGTEWGRQCIAGDLWLRLARARIEQAWSEGKRVVIDDVRFVNEAEVIESMGGFVIRIDRPGLVAGAHPSEQEQARITADWTIQNDGDVMDLELALGDAFIFARHAENSKGAAA